MEGESSRLPEDCAASGPARCRGGHSATGAAGARFAGACATTPRGRQADAVPRGPLTRAVHGSLHLLSHFLRIDGYTTLFVLNQGHAAKVVASYLCPPSDLLSMAIR